MSELRTRMIRDMALRGFSPRTHEAYVAAVVKLARYYHRAPDQLTNEQVQACPAHLMQERKLPWSTCSQAAHAFRFLYHVTLGRAVGRGTSRQRLTIFKNPNPICPFMLSREEVREPVVFVERVHRAARADRAPGGSWVQGGPGV